MVQYSFKNARFVTTAVKPEGYPILRSDSGTPLPEIAVVGRSNVGKSSLLNHLFQSKDLVKTSSTPGKTQALNFFVLDEKLVFVDLPGYGYAEVPLAVRKAWGPMIHAYLEKRQSLQLILFLFDIRRSPSEEDKQLLEWIAHHEKAVILVLTKTDKVKQNEKTANTAKIIKAFDSENLHFVHYSVIKNLGRKELISMLLDAIKDEQKEIIDGKS